MANFIAAYSTFAVLHKGSHKNSCPHAIYFAKFKRPHSIYVCFPFEIFPNPPNRV